MPTIEDLWQIIQQQREEIDQLKSRLEAQEVAPERARPERRPRRDRKDRISRAGLLKASAMGLVGLAGAEVAGSLNGQTAYADSLNTNFEAQKGTGKAFYQPDDGTAYGYSYGAYLFGQSVGVHGESRDNSGNLGDGYGVYGASATRAGIYGYALGGQGVYGLAASGTGVYGESAGSQYGVHGVSATGDGVYGSGLKAGVEGTGAFDQNGNVPSVGVLGHAGDSFPPLVPNTGVQGASNAGIGILGQSLDYFDKPSSGTGVKGTSGSGPGVVGASTSGIGVQGTSSSLFGLQGMSTASFGGVLVSTQGTGAIVEQAFILSADNHAPTFEVVRTGTNSSGNAHNYNGPLIFGHDIPSGSGGGSTPQSTGPLLQLMKNGITQCLIDGGGSLTLHGNLILQGPSTATSATAGTHGAAPSQVAGYLIVTIAGTQVKIPYYAV